MEDVVPLKPKKDESLLAGQTSEYIVDELPAFNSARSQYYFKKSNINDNKTAEELKDAL